MFSESGIKKGLALWTLCLGMGVAALPAHAAAPAVVLCESFESGDLAGWQTDHSNTVAVFRSAAPGRFSPKCLEVDKPDTTGLLYIHRKFPVPAGHWICITADLQTLRLGPFAQYFLRVMELNDAGATTATSRFLAFDDGITVDNLFGGFLKTPQTLGLWKETRHLLCTDAKTTQMDIGVVFKDGSQRVRFDELVVEDYGTEEPKLPSVPVYSEEVKATAGCLELDNLVPGFTYELTALTNTTDHAALGVRASAWDLRGKLLSSENLFRTAEDGRKLTYCLPVPLDAIKTRLEFYSSNTKEWEWAKAGARQWGRIDIRLVGRRPVADTPIHNFVHNIGDSRQIAVPPEYFTLTDTDRRALDQHLAGRAALDFELQQVKGGMAVMIGGKPAAPLAFLAWGTPHNEFDTWGAVAQRGVKIIMVDGPCGGAAMSGTWLAPGKYDFAVVDDLVYHALKKAPDAFFILHVGGLYPPAWWGAQHPDETLRNSDGLACSLYTDYGGACMWGPMKDNTLDEAAARKWGGHKWWYTDLGAKAQTAYAASPASRVFRDDMKDYLAALRRYIESRPYGKAVVGYWPHWGYDMQWGNLGAESNFDMNGAPIPIQLADYSRPMQQYFRDFLRRKYETIANLRQAWAKADVTFDTASIPSPAERAPKPGGNPPANRNDFFNPATQRNVIDFNECSAYVLGDLLSEMGEGMKAAGSRKILVGAYFQHVDRDMGQDAMLRRSGVDFSLGPDYDAREVGLAGISPQPHDSYRLHGKMEGPEIEYRIYPVLWRDYSNNQLFETPRKSISVLQREAMRQICTGESAWLRDMGYGWFNEPAIADVSGDIQRVFDRALTADRSSCARMAVFLCPSMYYSMINVGSCIRQYTLSKYLRAGYPHSGVPVDVYDIADLPQVADRYKVFIFPTAIALTDADMANVERLKRGGNVLVFGPAAGYVGTSAMSVDRVQQLTGIRMEQHDALPWTVRITDNSHPLTKDLVGFMGCEDAGRAGVDWPMFIVTDDKAVALGQYAGTDKTGLAVKDCGEWQSVYVGAMTWFPPELYRGLARMAGLHIFSDQGDAMYFAKELVGIHASSDGVKVIELPKECFVTSLWDNQDLGRLRTIRCEMRTGDNALYRLSTEK